MKVLVIDIQGFFNPPNFIPKEVAVTDGKMTGHYVFKPLTNRKFSVKEMKEKNYLEKFHHGIDYNYGNIEFGECGKILRKFLLDSDVVYVRGHQKVDYLRNLLTEEENKNILIFNVESSTPKFDFKEPLCFCHNLKTCICSLRNVRDLFNSVYNSLLK